ncbi:hypothetical protein [Cryptosporangium aurantiacum]|nr:hypothetical protein [Cryptosporangium aurantiacum]
MTSVARSTRRIWERVTVGLTLVTGTYLVLATIEPTRAVLERYVFKLDTAAIAALVAVMLEVCIIAIYQLGRDVRAMRRALEKQVSDNVIYDISEIVDRLRDTPHPHRADPCEVEVLGHTLAAVWPQLSAWVTSRAQPTNWKVVLYCLSPEFISECGQFPAYWEDESRRMQARIQEFVAMHRADMARRGLTIEVRPYACLSIVHGYRFQNGEIFMSFMEWSRDDKVTPYLFYERLSPDDRSARDNEYRELFNSWMRRVQRTAVPDSDLTRDPSVAGP